MPFNKRIQLAVAPPGKERWIMPALRTRAGDARSVAAAVRDPRQASTLPRPEIMQIRAMTPTDWPVVRTIYEEGIATGNATFQESVPTWAEWDAKHIQECRLVATEDGAAIVGWAALSRISSRCVYTSSRLGTARVLDAPGGHLSRESRECCASSTMRLSHCGNPRAARPNGRTVAGCFDAGASEPDCWERLIFTFAISWFGVSPTRSLLPATSSEGSTSSQQMKRVVRS